jgi:hypothetical protein
LGRTGRAAFDLLEIRPTTVAGAAALLVYYAEMEGKHEQVFPEHLDANGRPLDPGVVAGPWYGRFGFFLVRNVAASLGPHQLSVADLSDGRG